MWTLTWWKTVLLSFFKQGDSIMALITDLQTKVAALDVAQKAEAQRQADRAAALNAQIATLQATVDSLKAATVIAPADQAILDSAVVSIQGVIDALNAA